MKRLLIFILTFCSILLNLEAQEYVNVLNPYGIDESKREITPLGNGKHKIIEFTHVNVPVYEGELSSVDPLVRDGRYYFYNLNRQKIATGYYVQDVPYDKWVYSILEEDTLIVYDYKIVWDFLENESGFVAYDTLAMDSLSKKAKRSMNVDGTFKVVDELPTFHGERYDWSFYTYVEENLIYPIYAKKYNIKNNVILSFTLDYLGNIRNPEIVKSSLPDLSVEAMRVLLESGTWEAAKVEGKAVNVNLSWEFCFTCSEQARQRKIWYKQEENTVWVPDTLVSDTTIDGEIYFIVEDMPRFNNGDPATEFRKHIAYNLEYPEEAAEKGLQGRVIVQFTVDREGIVKNPTIVRGAHPLLNAEAIRVVMSSPRWTPGKQRGENVDVIFTFPINFVLQ